MCWLPPFAVASYPGSSFAKEEMSLETFAVSGFLVRDLISSKN